MSLAVSGETPGMDVAHRDVKRDTTQSPAKVAHLHSCTHTHTLPEVTQLAGRKIPTIEAAVWH